MDLKHAMKVLTHLGYAIRKDALTPEQQIKLRKDLTVAPTAAGGGMKQRYAKAGDVFSVYQESPTRFYCPRMWGLEQYGPPDSNILVEGDDARDDLHFVGKPYDYQEAIVDKFLDTGRNGLICVPCGRGKTFMAISIAARIGKKFMVIVDKEFLLQQWSGELRALMPGIRIGILQGDSAQITSDIKVTKAPGLMELKEMARSFGLKVGGNKDELLTRLKEAGHDVSAKTEIVEFDCCIAMIQTLVQRDFAETEFRPFGFAIFDECHHLGAANFSRALLKIQPQSMLGLSATPTRDDGLTKVFEWFLGKPVYWEKTREADPDVVVRRIPFDCEDEAYRNVPCDNRGEMILARLLTQVCECEPRAELIDRVLCELVKDKRRRILVLSERKSHLERIEKGLPKDVTYGYYIGGMKEEIREAGAQTAQVLLGTYAMASEAMNIKTLNTMLMASPRKKIEQSIGRIMRVRKDERDVQPLIYDIVDSHDVYENQWRKRKVYYKKCSYRLEVPEDESFTRFRVETSKKKASASASASASGSTHVEEEEEKDGYMFVNDE